MTISNSGIEFPDATVQDSAFPSAAPRIVAALLYNGVTQTVVNSFNISGVTRNAAGSYSGTFANEIPANAFTAVNVVAGAATYAGLADVIVKDVTQSGFNVLTPVNNAATALGDASVISVLFFAFV